MVIAQRIVLLIMFHAVFWPTLSFAETKTLQPEAFIDLSKWNPDDGEFRLEGDWSHWPRQLLEDIEVGPQQRIDILSGAFVDEADHGNYLTHGVQLRGLPKALDYLSIRLGVIDTAHRLWAIDSYGNRRVISEAGTVGRTKEEAVPSVVWTHASLAGLAGPVLDLFLEISGYRSAYIGVWRMPVIGLTKDLDKDKFNRLAFVYTLLGVLLMATIFHFVLFWLRPQDKVNLWFSLLCGGLALRHAASERIFEALLSVDALTVYNVRYRVEYFMMYALCIIGASFFKQMYPLSMGTNVMRIVKIVFGVLCVISLGPTHYLGHLLDTSHVLMVLLLSWVLWAHVKEYRAGNSKAVVSLVAFVVLGASAIHDIMNAREAYGHLYFLPFGVVGFILLQSYMIARMFADTYNLSKSLSRDLKSELDLRSALEGTLVQVQGRLIESRDQLNQAETQVIQADKLATLGGLIASIGHELRSPLQTIHLGNDLMQEEIKNVTSILDPIFEGTGPEADAIKARLDKHFDELIRARQDGDKCIRQMLDVSNALHRGSRLDLEPVLYDLNEIIEDAVILVSGKLKGCKVSLELEQDMEIRCRASHLRQVFTNILANAADAIEEKHGFSNGTVVVTSVLKRVNNVDGVLIGLEDNGPGIPEDIRAKILKPFFTTKAAGVGTGIGLAVTAKIIKNHQGTITVGESDRLGGASFSIWIPTRGTFS
ncbi:MAG: sensor histidine kinase [Deltaproteobacteria bacterium]|nr:sensor histidine kinase [Deltaproteobacteria bacterium]